MGRTLREPGRPRADWDKDPAFVRQWCTWAIREGYSPGTIKSGRSIAKMFHRFLVSRHGRDYYRPDHGTDKVGWEDAYAFKEQLVAKAQAGELVTQTAKNRWMNVTRWYHWRAKFDPQDADAAAQWTRVSVFASARDFPKGEDLDSGVPPYDIENFHKILDASRAGPLRSDSPNEDHFMAMLGAYTGQRAQIVGLRWQDVHLDDPDPTQHELIVRTKGGRMKRFPLLAPLEAALRELRARDPTRTRMVFASSEYPWDDKVPATGQCEYELAGGKRCPEIQGLKLHYGREGDEVFCRSHHMRTLVAARETNQDLASWCMSRIEAELRELHPDLEEERLDPKTGQSSLVPVHLTWHRFRKTLATWYEEFGLPEVLVAKIVGWNELKTMRQKYHRPARRRLYEAASKVDLVEASRAAARGEDLRPKSELETVVEVLRQELERSREENERLRRSLADVVTQLRSGTVRVDVGP